MMIYYNGTRVHVGDHIDHHTKAAVVEDIIEGGKVARWDLDEPGFLLRCDECGRVLISVGSADWEDVTFIRRGA